MSSSTAAGFFGWRLLIIQVAGKSVKKEQFRSVVVLTGAGISAESGLRTFRDNGGLWEGHRIEEVATPEAFARSPATVQRFYNERRAQLQTEAVKANAAHIALAEFEQEFDGQFTLITQNVDDLHQRAGSRQVLPMHGELLSARCLQCSAVKHWHNAIEESSRCDSCGASDCLRPHIVWFGEEPLFMKEIIAATTSCDLFVAIGTSAAVYPAAGLSQYARESGAITVELNLEPSLNSDGFDVVRLGPAGEIVPAFFSDVIRGSVELR